MRKIQFIILVIFGVAVLVYLDHWLDLRWRQEKAKELQSMVQLCCYRLESGFEIRLSALESMVSLFTIHPETTPEEFAIFAAGIIRYNAPIRSLQYADSKTRVTYVFPSQTNEIVVREPKVLATDPKKGAFVRKAIQQKRAVVQGPFELSQGGGGIVVRTPIFDGDRFLGLAIGVYDVPVLLTEMFSQMNAGNLLIQLADGDGRVFYGPPSLPQGALKSQIPIADSWWTLSMAWQDSSLNSPALQHLIILICGGGFILFVFILFQQSWNHTKRLETILVERTKEITIRKEMEAALKESETLFRGVFENAAAAIVKMTPDGRISHANDVTATLLGYSAREIIGMPLQQIIHPDELEEAQRYFAQTIAEGRRQWQVERKLIRKDGTPFWAKLNVSALKGPGGNVETVLIVATDITSRVLAEQGLLESELRFRSIFENNHAAMLLIDPETGEIVDANPAAAEYYGYPRETLKTMQITDINVLSEAEVRAEMQIAKSQGRRFLYFRHRLADGAVKDVEVFSGPVDVQGKRLLCSFIQDITARKQMEIALREKEKLQGVIEMSGAVCHEISQPLQAISGFVDLLSAQKAGDPDLTEKLMRIQENIQRLKRISERLMRITQYRTKAYMKSKIIDIEQSSENQSESI